MKHIRKINEANNPSLEELANNLIKMLEDEYKSLPHTVGRPVFEWEDDLREARSGKVVSQYGDFFFIIGRSVESMDLPILEVLLRSPFNGKLYASRQDNLLQIRISGYTANKLF